MSENNKERTQSPGIGGNIGGGRPGMGGGNMGGGERAKDFKASWGKLIKYCKSYMPVIVVALIIASVGTVFQFIGPDKIKDMATTITGM
jgi:ATP-binding cassette subfamily B protein